MLTYSLTNTITTIESLHEELAQFQQDSAQKLGGPSIIKTIHQYAREIAKEEKSFEESQQEEDIMDQESHNKPP